MPTMNCASCGKLVPIRPVECPHCKAVQAADLPVPSRDKGRLLAVGAASLLLGATAGYMAVPSSKPAPLAPLQPIAFPERPKPAPTVFPPQPAPFVVSPARQRAGTVNYQMRFLPGSSTMMGGDETVVGRIADTLRYYPLDRVNIIGYASQDEGGDEALAASRARSIQQLLLGYGLKVDKLQTQTRIVARAGQKVDVYIIPGQ